MLNDLDKSLKSEWGTDFHSTPYLRSFPPGEGGGVLPYISYIGMCGPKGYGFSAVLVIKRVSIFADFGHLGHLEV